MANYPTALTSPGFDFSVLLRNTLTYGILETIGMIIACTLVSYSFARLRWPGRDIFFVLILATMMIPGTVTMIPIYIIFRHLGWIDSYCAADRARPSSAAPSTSSCCASSS